MQILDEDIAQAAVGGPTGQGRAVVCSRVRRQEAGGRRQEMFVIRAFPFSKLPSSPDWAVGKGQGATKCQPWGLRQVGRHSWGPLGLKKGCTWG